MPSGKTNILLKNAQRKLAKDLKTDSKDHSEDSTSLKEKSRTKATKQKRSDDSSSMHTDDGLKDDEARVFTLDENTGEKVETKEKVGFDRLQ